MKLLFAALHHGYYRNYESVIETLASRGHELYLGAERRDSAIGGQAIVERLSQGHPNVRHGAIPGREPESSFVASKVRLSYDYLRYLDPMYGGVSGLRPRAEVRTPAGFLRLTRSPLLSLRPARWLLAQALDAIDRAVPPSPAIERFLDEQRPDAVFVTPLIGLVASSQLDILRSALARRLPTAVLVWSWDHLSSKAIIRDLPDRVFVWNHVQMGEAMSMHGVPPERVEVTGAQCFDQWFDRKPARGRADFVRDVGLADERPYVLWACSALLPGGPPEPELVLRWARHIRSSPIPSVRNAAILVRPHPSRTAEWDGVEWPDVPNMVLFGDNPIDQTARATYFDSLYHSAAVVGITTSAFVEAAIIGRPVMTIRFDEIRHEHEGSLHFQHLLKVEGGLMTSAATLDEHALQLADMIGGPPARVVEQQSRFVRAFVRPHGLDTPATGIMADALEQLAASVPTTAVRAPSAFGRFGLRKIAALEHHPRWRSLLLDEREAEVDGRWQEKERLHEEEMAGKRQRRAERMRAYKEQKRGKADR